MIPRGITPPKTKSTANVAFAVVVCVSYLAMISNAFEALTTTSLVWLLVLGTVYTALGIYGYEIATRSRSYRLLSAYFIIQLGLGATIVALGRGAGFNAILLLPLAGQAVVALPQYGALAVSIGIMLGYISAIYATTGNLSTLWDNLVTFLAGLVFIVVFTQLTVDEGKARAEVERLAVELESANRRLREYAAQAEELATSRERNRLAREIHDGLGHYLTTIHVQLQAAEAVFNSDPRRARNALEKARALTQTALADVRRSVGALRTSEPTLPLPERLKALLSELHEPDLRVELSVTGAPRPLAPTVETACYRAAQQRLNNIRKHSQAAHALLSLDYSQPDRLCLSLSDDGSGTGDASGGFGLIGIRERLELIGGSLVIHTAPRQGFLLQIEVPG
jgi:signal transduction histidine kinase